MFNNKDILITGGTGSFGNAFVMKILSEYKPKRLIIFSRDELKQYDMRKKFDHSCLRFFLGDVRDYDRLLQAMKGVDYVVHAAALKQVPSSEYNPDEFIKTNIYGAQNVINAAIKNNVESIIALSTDKAANPINLYGATKLTSDKLFIAANNSVGKQNTKFSVVRYGNVVGSRGSVVPLFQGLYEEGNKKIPITHKDMTRFGITLEKGILFVIKSFQRTKGGEVFVPKSPSVKIVDVAKAFAPGAEIEYIGIRPGEKISEVLCPSEGSYLIVEFDDHFVIEPSIVFSDIAKNFKTNCLNEKGKKIEEHFEYNSANNSHFLTVEEIKNYL